MQYLTMFCLLVLLTGYTIEAQVLTTSSGSCHISPSGLESCNWMSGIALRSDEKICVHSFRGRDRRMRFPISFPSPSFLAGSGIALVETLRSFTIGAPLPAKTLSDFCREPTPEGHGGKMLEETSQLYTFRAAKVCAEPHLFRRRWGRQLT